MTRFLPRSLAKVKGGRIHRHLPAHHFGEACGLLGGQLLQPALRVSHALLGCDKARRQVLRIG